MADTLPSYQAQRDKWGLSSGLLDATSTQRPKPTFSRLALKLTVAMEMLKESFVAATGYCEFARPDDEFGQLVPALKNAITKVLTGAGWQSSERSIAYGNIRALRIPFGHLLKALCAHVDLQLPEEDVHLFVPCRNGLVHRGRFYCETAG